MMKNDDEGVRGSVDTKPPYRIYVAIIALFVVIRFLDLATQESNWAYDVYNSAVMQWTLPVLAFLTASFSAGYLRHRAPTTVVILLAGCVGAITTLLTNSAIGMIVGLGTGTAIVFSPVARENRGFRSLLLWNIRSFVSPILWGAGIGLSVACLWLYLKISLEGRLGVVLFAGGLGMLLFAWRYHRNNSRRTWIGWLSGGVLFIAATLICMVSVFSLNLRWCLSRPGVIISSPNSGLIGLVWPQLLQSPNPIIREFETWTSIGFSHVRVTTQATDENLNDLTTLPMATGLMIDRDSQVTDAGIGALGSLRLQHFICEDGTRLTNDVMVHLDPKRLQWLRLYGPNFSDDALLPLKQAIELNSVSLRLTQVTSTGLADNLHPSSPLWDIELTGTKVDDDVFVILSRFPVMSIILSDTQITGAGLRHLQLKNLGQLDLSRSRLVPENLAELLTIDPKSGEAIHLGRLQSLNLAGIQLSDEAVNVIAKLRGLKYLDISGSSISEASLSRLVSLMTLDELSMNGEAFRADRSGRFPGKKVTLHYDAMTTPPAEIFRDVRRIMQSLGKGVDPTTNSDELPVDEVTRPPVPHLSSVRIRHVALSEEIRQQLSLLARELAEAPLQSDLVVENGVSPNGSTETFVQGLDVENPEEYESVTE